MKKSIIIVVVIVIIGLIIWGVTRDNGTTKGVSTETPAGSETTVSAPVSETTKVSDKLSEYKNEELGFSVKYP
jgi:hypothetical protein